MERLSLVAQNWKSRLLNKLFDTSLFCRANLDVVMWESCTTNFISKLHPKFYLPFGWRRESFSLSCHLICSMNAHWDHYHGNTGTLLPVACSSMNALHTECSSGPSPRQHRYLARCYLWLPKELKGLFRPHFDHKRLLTEEKKQMRLAFEMLGGEDQNQ